MEQPPTPPATAGGQDEPRQSAPDSSPPPPIATDTPRSSLLYVVGLNEGELGGRGWHARTRDARCGVASRPLEPEAFWRLDPLPSWRAARQTLRLRALLCAAPSLLGRPVDVFLWAACVRGGAAPETLRAAETTWRAVGEWKLATDAWVWREAVVDLSEVGAERWRDDGDARLLLRLDTTPEFVPARCLGNRDYRSMGVQWGALRVEAAQEAAP